MQETTENDLKRTRIFSILDDLQEKGERINADKIARLGKMGKQTVLPYYNEWRFLSDLSKDDGSELPQDLVRSLKREIGKWKHDLSEQQRAQEESANQEIDELKQTLQQVLEKNETLSKECKSLQEANSQLTQELEERKKEEQDYKLQLQSLESKLGAEQMTVKQSLESLNEQKLSHQESMKEMERHLDLRNQEQVNHWLKVVDDERQTRKNLEKTVTEQNDKIQSMNKTMLELENRLENKSRAYLKACEDKNDLANTNKELKEISAIAEKSALILDCKESEAISIIRSLLDEKKEHSLLKTKYDDSRTANTLLESKLESAEVKLSNLSQIEFELERLRGAAEAFEKTARAGNK